MSHILDSDSSAQKPKYYDKRAEFFSSYFKQALSYQAFIATGSPAQRDKWEAFRNKISLNSQQTAELQQFKRKLNLLVLAGVWCGDCARQGAMLHNISLGSKLIDLRFIDNQQNPELQDELRIIGASRVPVAVFLSEDFFELERFGDRTLSVYMRKAQNELGPACDAGLLGPAAAELELELSEWFSHFQRMQLILRLAPGLRARYQD